jgi:hypothetical protein
MVVPTAARSPASGRATGPRRSAAACWCARRTAGARILFAGLAHPDSAWRIYMIAADGTGFRQVTRTDRRVPLAQFGAAAARFVRYDDIDPCWLPDGRICFASTRYPMLAEFGDHLATNLFVAGEDGVDPQRITTERSGGEEPVIDPRSGRVVFSRWWINLDRPSNVTRDGLTVLDAQALTQDVGNIWQTVSVTPDGRAARLHAGDPRTRTGMLCYKPAMLPDGRVLALCAANPSFSPNPAGTGVRLFEPGASTGRFVLGRRPGAHAPAEDTAPDPRDAACAADAVALPDGRLLLSYAPEGAADLDLHVCSLEGGDLERVLDMPGTLELDAQPLVRRPVPPVLADEIQPPTAPLPPTEDPASFDANGTYRFDCLNVFMNAPVDAPIPNAPPIARDTRIRLYLNFQRQDPRGRDPSILIRDSPLTARGAVTEQGIPADLPIFGQIVDAEGKVLVGPDGKVAHVTGFGFARHGGWAQCVGCHAGHSVQTIPNNFTAAEWFNASTSAHVQASSVWVPAGGAAAPCPGSRVVDRKARNDSLEVTWVAAGRNHEAVVLSWPVPIEVTRFVLYGIRPDPRSQTDLSVESCSIALLRAGRVVGRVARSGRVVPEGTVVALAAATVIDAAKIELLEVRGRVRGLALAGLAEVETIARLALPD